MEIDRNLLGTYLGAAGYIACQRLSSDPFVYGSLGDVSLNVGFYFAIRGIMPKLSAAVTSTGIACLTELAQLAGIFPGVYDPKDFAMFAAGSVLAAGIDKLTEPEGESLDNLLF